VPTIRYYEEIGLLRPADRQAGGQRVYGDDDVKRLTFVRRCRDLGFPLNKYAHSLRSCKTRSILA
jgi:DNA-binding transcriptional MerR regulator